MRTLPDGLQAHLDGGATTLCRCWKLAPHNGPAMGFTDHDRDLSFNGVQFEAAAGFTASEFEAQLGFAPGNLEAAGALDSARLNEHDLAAGRFDHAAVDIWLVNWADVSQRMLLHSGTLGEVTRGETGFTVEIRGLAQGLDQPGGRLFQYTCDARLGDPRCAVDLADPAYTIGCAVLSVGSRSRFEVSGLEAYTDGWFDRGTVSWLSGANAGQIMEVKRHAASAAGWVIELWHAMPADIQPGDQLSLAAGCDKHFGTCREKFANTENFRGFPHMPGNDFVTSYPNRDDAGHDGASRSTGHV